jgi:hypothetical protein
VIAEVDAPTPEASRADISNTESPASRLRAVIDDSTVAEASGEEMSELPVAASAQEPRAATRETRRVLRARDLSLWTPAPLEGASPHAPARSAGGR